MKTIRFNKKKSVHLFLHNEKKFKKNEAFSNVNPSVFSLIH